MASNDPDVLPMWIIFDRPADFPDFFVVRRFDVRRGGNAEATDELTTHATIEDARLAVPCECVLIARSPEDHPTIVETWL